MKFVVLIACHNCSDSIYSTIESLSSVNVPAELECVIIIENGDIPNLDTTSLSSAGKLPVLCYFTNHKGKSAALNVAITQYVPDNCFILFTDDDIRFDSDWLTLYARALEKKGRGYFYGASLGVDYEDKIDPDLLFSLPPSARGVSDLDFKKNPNRAFLGCNWAAHKDDILKAGLFNPNFGPGSKTGATGQEAEMQDRLRKLNLKPILVENNLVWHRVPLERCTVEWAKKRAERTGMERYRRKKGRGKWLIYSVLLIIVSGFRSLFGSKKARYHFMIKTVAVKAFIKQLFRKNGAKF